MRSAILLLIAALMGCATTQPKHETVAYQAPVELVQHMPEGIPGPLGAVRAFQVSCGTGATIIGDGQPYLSIVVWNNSATPVYIGWTNVTASTTNGYPICTDTATCPRADMPMDARHGYCRVASGTVTLSALAGGL